MNEIAKKLEELNINVSDISLEVREFLIIFNYTCTLILIMLLKLGFHTSGKFQMIRNLFFLRSQMFPILQRSVDFSITLEN